MMILRCARPPIRESKAAADSATAGVGVALAEERTVAFAKNRSKRHRRGTLCQLLRPDCEWKRQKILSIHSDQKCQRQLHPEQRRIRRFENGNSENSLQRHQQEVMHKTCIRQRYCGRELVLYGVQLGIAEIRGAGILLYRRLIDPENAHSRAWPAFMQAL